jgi:hypothetical protein
MARASVQGPTQITVRAYQVGFGDCFLLTFHYPEQGGDRHVLIDFGSTGAPKGFGDLDAVAESIQRECGGKLHAVVATHRHKDHISGFATQTGGKGSGDIIAACRPDVIVQPWTEDPDAQPDATAATTALSPGSKFVRSLQDIHIVAASVVKEVRRRIREFPEADAADTDTAANHAGPEGDEEMVETSPATPTAPRSKKISRLAQRLLFMGDNNLSNRSAIENLIHMGKQPGARASYVYFGAESGLENVLPGVRIRVLGPPTIEQTDSIRSQRQTDESEFWQLQAGAGVLAASPERRLFDAPVLEGSTRPKPSRWLTRRMRSLRGDQLREIVRILDKAMNNTSVILLFEIGKQKLLFPGDAQIENWQYALSQPKIRELLEQVTFYKVGHHGSLNATPKSLWAGFGRKSTEETPARLRTVVSTMAGKHGDTKRDTEVPRETLVEALKSESDFFSTQAIKKAEGKLFWSTKIEI